MLDTPLHIRTQPMYITPADPYAASRGEAFHVSLETRESLGAAGAGGALLPDYGIIEL